LNGKDGAPGDRGLQGEKGLDGLHGRDGRDGASGAPGLPGEKGLDGRPGVDGINGADGLDGLGFDDYDLTLDETRGWLLRLSQGERVNEWELGLPFDAKVYAAGTVYPKGAGVTADGHYWIALTQTSDPPGEGNPAWRIAVRRGKQGKEGQRGKEGSPGKDLTQIDPATGRKW
jgi:integrin beta 3